MAWDLRGALLKKQEVETARLLDFEFALRARTMRLLAAELGLDPDALAARIVEGDDSAVLAILARDCGLDLGAQTHRHALLRAEARRALIAERGDPSPVRLL